MRRYLFLTFWFYALLGLISGNLPAQQNSADSILLDNWALQDPTGQTLRGSYREPFKDKPWFYYDSAEGSYIFAVPRTGYTTPHSQHVRCELRQLSHGKPAAWNLTKDHELSFSGMVTQLAGGSRGRTTLAQIFDASRGKPLTELEFGSGKLLLLVETTPKGGSSVLYPLAFVPLGQRYSLKLGLSRGKLWAQVSGQAPLELSLASSFLQDKFYFKLGNYDQTSRAGPLGPPETVVKVFYSTLTIH